MYIFRQGLTFKCFAKDISQNLLSNIIINPYEK